MTYYKASRFACATGFPLISLENKEKIECVTAAFFGLWIIKFKKKNSVITFLDEKKIPTGRYWVSLMSMGCTTTHRWCNFADNPYLQEFQDFVWKKGEPSVDPTKECVAVDFQRDYPYFTFLKLDCNIQLKSLSEAKNTA